MKKYNYTNQKSNAFNPQRDKKCNVPNTIGDIDIDEIPVKFSPAITFGNQNVYLPNGDIAVIKPNIELSFSSIDKNFITNIINNQNPKINNKNSELVFGCIDNEIKMIEGRYNNTLENLKNVFICHVNDIFYNPNTETYAFKIDVDSFNYNDIGFNYVMCGPTFDIKTSDSKYVSTLWKESTLQTIILTNLNSTSIRFYYHIKEQILKFISFINISPSAIEEIFAKVDKYFASMMADMTYETSIAFYSIEQLIPFIEQIKKSINPANTIDNLKHRDVISNNIYSPINYEEF